MKIDGKLIASEIKKTLKIQISDLKSKNVTSHLAVILAGSDPSSHTYVRQKQKVGEEIGAKVTIHHPSKLDKLVQLVQSLNTDPSVHGIIIQRPLPFDIPKHQLDQLVIPAKDVDGFHPDSPFTPPIALAVIEILKFIFKNQTINYQLSTNNSFLAWLQAKKVLIIGRGETGGKPIADYLKKLKIPFTLAHSKTSPVEFKKLTLNADIIISAVGKSNIVRPSILSSKSILIGVGLHPEDDKLKPDYNQE